MAGHPGQKTAMARQHGPAVFHPDMAFDRGFRQIAGLGKKRDKRRPDRQNRATAPFDRAPSDSAEQRRRADPAEQSGPGLIGTDPRHQARSADQAAEHIAADIHQDHHGDGPSDHP